MNDPITNEPNDVIKPPKQSDNLTNKSPQESKPTSSVFDPNLTRKELEVIKTYVNNPKLSKTDAYKAVFNSSTSKQSSLHSQASQLFRKPTVQSSLANYTALIEETLIGTVEDWGRHEKPRQREIAIDTAKFVHDKIHGRATQRIEQQSTGITFKIDLTSSDDIEPISND